MIVNIDSFNLNLFTAKGYTAQPSKVVMTIWSIVIGTLVQLPQSGILCMEVLVVFVFGGYLSLEFMVLTDHNDSTYMDMLLRLGP